MSQSTDSEKMPLALLRIKAGMSCQEASIAMKIGIDRLDGFETGLCAVPSEIAKEMARIYCVSSEEVRDAIEETRKILTPTKAPPSEWRQGCLMWLLTLFLLSLLFPPMRYCILFLLMPFFGPYHG